MWKDGGGGGVVGRGGGLDRRVLVSGRRYVPGILTAIRPLRVMSFAKEGEKS